MHKNLLKPILYGVAVGDALGVPVEFKSREYLKENPVTKMLSFGTHDQPTGTWSDDTSLTLCLAETIVEGFDLQKLAAKFIAWKEHNYWTPHGWVFDIGIGTRIAIEKLANGEQPELGGGFGENDNGNGSLMRILPLVVLTKDLPIDERFQLTKKVSSVTHAHIRSIIACFYYLEFAKQIIEGKDKFAIYENLKVEVPKFLNKLEIDKSEIALFNRLFIDNVFQIEEDKIESSGYVLHTLEASIWCLLTTNNYAEATLKAINLGKDTDTTGAVTGGLVGLLYGFENIPKKWITVLKKIEEINQLIHKFLSTHEEFETNMNVQYLYSGTTECEEFTKEIDNYNHTLKTTLSLTNSNGNNTLIFNFINPFSKLEESVVLSMDSESVCKNGNGNAFWCSFLGISKNENHATIKGDLIFVELDKDDYHVFQLEISLNEKQIDSINNSTIYIGSVSDVSK